MMIELRIRFWCFLYRRAWNLYCALVWVENEGVPWLQKQVRRFEDWAARRAGRLDRRRLKRKAEA
jgi:hypothetical protein